MVNFTIPKDKYPLLLSADEVITVYNLLKIGDRACQKPYCLAKDVLFKARALNNIIQKERSLDRAIGKYQDAIDPPLPF